MSSEDTNNYRNGCGRNCAQFKPRLVIRHERFVRRQLGLRYPDWPEPNVTRFPDIGFNSQFQSHEGHQIVREQHLGLLVILNLPFEAANL